MQKNNNYQNHNPERVTKRENNPTEDAQEFLNDTSGRTGVTTNPKNLKNRQLDEDLSQTMSGEMQNQTRSTARGGEHPQDEPARATSDFGMDDETHTKGEESASGSAPAADADDDTLDNSHDMGLRLDEDEEHPQELDVGSDIDRAEEYKHTH